MVWKMSNTVQIIFYWTIWNAVTEGGKASLPVVVHAVICPDSPAAALRITRYLQSLCSESVHSKWNTYFLLTIHLLVCYRESQKIHRDQRPTFGAIS